MNWNRLVWPLLLFSVLSTPAMAQHSGAYVFAGPVVVSSNYYTYWQGPFLHAGGGGEAGIGSHFTIGAEGGALMPRQRYGRSAGLLSAGPYFHFLRADRKIDPFVTAGGALLVSNGAGGLAYFGGGANYWFHNRAGARLEFRDHIWAPEGTAFHFLEFRAGLAFRFGGRQ